MNNVLSHIYCKWACKNINYKKGGANTTNQIRIRIRPTPSSKQIKIREYEYEPSCRIREYGQPVANTNTSPGYVFIWLYLLYLYDVTLVRGGLQNLAQSVRKTITRRWYGITSWCRKLRSTAAGQASTRMFTPGPRAAISRLLAGLGLSF